MTLTWPSLPTSCDGAPAVFPEFFRMDSWETLPLCFDASGMLGSTPILFASAQLIQLNVGTDYAAGRAGPVQIDGASMTQIVTSLVPHQRYRLVIQFSTDGVTIWAPYLIVECVA